MGDSLSVFIDGITPVEADDAEEFHWGATDLEAEIESVLADALRDHPYIEAGATVSAEYIQREE